jgi:hypothetical protein
VRPNQAEVHISRITNKALTHVKQLPIKHSFADAFCVVASGDLRSARCSATERSLQATAGKDSSLSVLYARGMRTFIQCLVLIYVGEVSVNTCTVGEHLYSLARY